MSILSGDNLKRYNLFSGLSESALGELARKMETINISRGVKLIQQGTPADYFYFIRNGEVEIIKESGPGQMEKLSVISSGQVFGEIALLTCSHRCCSVFTKTDATLYRLAKTDFEEIIMMDSAFTSVLVKKIEHYSQFNKLRTLKPFALLEPEKMLALTGKLKEKSYSAGEEVIAQGDQGDLFYIVKSGHVEVLIRKKGNPDAEQVAVLDAGEGFGEEALIRDQRRNATVRSLGKSTLLILSKKDFDSILKTSFLDFIFPEDIERIPADRANYVLLDARIPPEYEEEHIEGAINIPMETLRQKYSELDPSKDYYTYCTNDSRGMAAAFLLRTHGFKAKNLRGGLSGWTGAVVTGSDGIHFPNAG